MKKFLILALALFAVAGLSFQAQAAVASAYSTNDYKDMQTIVYVYNSGARGTLYENNIDNKDVVLYDTGATAGTTLGKYGVRGGSTSGSVYFMGIADEDIVTGAVGRVCVYGPHYVVTNTDGKITPAAGQQVVASAYTAELETTTHAGEVITAYVADGTAEGVIGLILGGSGTDWIVDVRPYVHK